MVSLIIILLLLILVAYITIIKISQNDKLQYFGEVIDQGTYKNTTILICAGEANPFHFLKLKEKIEKALKNGAIFNIIAGPVFVIPYTKWKKYVKGKKEEEINFSELHVLFKLAKKYPKTFHLYRTKSGSKDNRRFRMPLHFSCTNKKGTPVAMENPHLELQHTSNWIIHGNDRLREKTIDIFKKIKTDGNLIEGRICFENKRCLKPSGKMFISSRKKLLQHIFSNDYRKLKEDLKILKETIGDNLSWWGPFATDDLLLKNNRPLRRE